MADDETQALAKILVGEDARYCGPGYGTCGSVSVDWEHAQDLAVTVVKALPGLGWVRPPGMADDATVVHEWAARWVDEVDGPGYTPEQAREQVTRNGVPGDMGEVVRRTVRTVTTPDGWTHVSTGPWEVLT